MKKHCLGWTSFFLILSACSGWNSELDTAFIEDASKSKAPVCEFEASNTCYARSVELLMSCVQPIGEEPELLDDDKELCSNNKGKNVLFFENSLIKYATNEKGRLDFKVKNGQETCFHFQGNQDSFTVDDKDYGRLSVRKLENGDTLVNCFFGEELLIPKAAADYGCRKQKTKVVDFLPSHDLLIKKKTKESGVVVFDHFQFSFLGTGTPVAPVFKCQL